MRIALSNVKSIFVKILMGLSLISAVFGVTFTQSTAKANQTEPASQFFMLEGASIRFTDPSGIRFTTYVNKEYYETLKAKGAVFGTLIIGKNYLGDRELTIDAEGNFTEGANNVIANNWATNLTNDDATANFDESLYNKYNAVVVGAKNGEHYAGLSENMYDLTLIARSYVIYENELGQKVVEFATGAPERSYAEVAKTLLLQGYEYGTEYLHKITNTVASKNAETPVEINVGVDSNYSATINSSNGSVKSVYLVEGNTTTLVDSKNYSFANNTLTFNEDFIKSLKLGTYTFKLFCETAISSLQVTVSNSELFIPTFRMVVTSDMHISENNSTNSMDGVKVDVISRFANMFKQMNSYASNHELYNKLDAVLLAGDITDYGRIGDYNAVKNVIDNNKSSETQIIQTMGNHDFWADKTNSQVGINNYVQVFGEQPYHHKVVGGYHFITLLAEGNPPGYTNEPGYSYSTEMVEFARTEIAKAKQAYIDAGTPNKPIFVMQHVALRNTVASSQRDDNNSTKNDALYQIFAENNVVCFAGHSHFSINDECSIHQKDFTSLGTGGLYYSTRVMLNGSYLNMDNRVNLAQNYVIEMDANSRMRIRCWDVLQNKFIGDTWELNGYNDEDFVYTEDRFNADDLYFDNDASIEVEASSYKATISFDKVAKNSLTARAYLVIVKDSTGYEMVRSYVCPDYFNEKDVKIQCLIGSLAPNSTYSVSVTALNPLYSTDVASTGTLQSVPLTCEFTTPALPPRKANEVLSFDSSNDLQHITGNGTSLSWVENAHGVNGGLLKGTHTAGFSLSFDATKLAPNFADYDWLVVRARFNSNSNAATTSNNNFCGISAEYMAGWMYHDSFRNYVYKISSLTKEQLQNATLTYASSSSATAGDYYIDEIFFLKDDSKADLSLDIDGALKTGETLGVSVNNPSKVTIKSYTLTDPDGNVVPNPSSFVAVAGTYTATVVLFNNYTDSIFNAGYLDKYNNTTLTYTFVVKEATDGVVNFESSSSADKVTVQNATSFEYVANAPVDGTGMTASKGALKVTHSSDVELKVNVTTLATNYAEYDWVIVRGYFPKSSNDVTNITNVKINGSNCDGWNGGWTANNYWINLPYNISALTETELQNLTILFDSIGTGESSFYVEEIYLMKDISKSDISVKTYGALLSGKNITLEVVNPSNAEIKNFVLTDPSGDVVENPYSFVTVGGEYTATITLISDEKASRHHASTRNTLYYGGRNTVITYKFTVNLSDQVFAFDSASEISSLTQTGATSLEIVENVTDNNSLTAAKALKVTHSQNVTFTFDVTKLAPDYTKYDWLIVRAYFPKTNSETTNITNVKINDTAADGWDSSWTANNYWINLPYNISTLTEAELQKVTVTFIVQGTGEGAFYLDEIYLMQDIAKSDISVEVTGTKLLGETLSVEVVNPSNAAIKKFEVKDPSGDVVSDPSSFTATSGVYTATVTLISGETVSRHHASTRNTLYYGGKNTVITYEFNVVERKDTVFNFDSASELNGVSSTSSDMTLSHVTDANGTQGGFLKVELNKTLTSGSVKFDLTEIAPYFGEFDWIVVRAYIVGAGSANANQVNYIKMLGQNPHTYYVYHDAWKSYVYDFRGKSLDTLKNISIDLSANGTGDANGVVYIDEIFLMKDISKSDISVSVNGTLKEGQLISVEAVNPSNAEIKEIIVTNAKGDRVSDPSSFIATPGKYTVKVVLTRKTGTWNEPFSESMRYALYYGGGETYITDTFEVEALPKATISTTTTTFDSASDLDNFTSSNTTLEFVNDKDGKTGVLHATHTGVESTISFDLTKLVENYFQYDYVVIYARYNKPSNTTFANYATIFGSHPIDYYLYHDNWRHYVYSIKGKSPQELANTTLRVYGGTAYEGTVGEYWIDEIYLLQDVSKADFSIETTGNLLAGQTIGVELVNPNEAQYYSFTVKDPNGNTVENSSSFTAMAGTYTVELVPSYWFTNSLRDHYFKGAESKLTYSFTVEKATTLMFDFTEASGHTAYYGANSGAYLTSYEGATNVVKGAYDDDWVGIQFRLNTTKEALANFNLDYVELKVAVDFTGSRTSWDGYYEYSKTAGWTYTTSGVWRIYRAEKQGLINQFGSLENFYTAITTGTGSNSTSRLFVLWNMRAHGNFYFDYIKLVAAVDTIDFDDANDINLLTKGHNAQILSSVAGSVGGNGSGPVSNQQGSFYFTESNVLQFNHTNVQYDGFWFKYDNPNNITVDDWSEIRIRARVLRGASSGTNELSEGSFASGWRVAGLSVSPETIQRTASVGWATMTITKSLLTASGGLWAGDINAFWTQFTSDTGAPLLHLDWVHATKDGTNGWYIQIDKISLV